MKLTSELLGPGVYLLLRAEKVVYVGMSKSSMLSRVGDHIENKNFDAVQLLPFPRASLEELKLRESLLILEHAPEYNYGNGKKTAGRLLLSSRHVGPNRSKWYLPPELKGLLA